MPAQSASVGSGPPATTTSMISAVTTGSSQSGVSFSAKKPTAARTRRRCRSSSRNTERIGCRPSIACSIWESVCPVIVPLCRRSGPLATLDRCRSILAASPSTLLQPPHWPDTDSSTDSSTRRTPRPCTAGSRPRTAASTTAARATSIASTTARSPPSAGCTASTTRPRHTPTCRSRRSTAGRPGSACRADAASTPGPSAP